MKNLPANVGDIRNMSSILGWEDPLEEEMATHSSILAWRIPGTEEPGGLQSTGLQSQTQLSDQHFHFSHSLAQVLERRSDTLIPKNKPRD